MAGDWIKLHRRMLDSAVMRHDGLCRLWIYCLLRANWQARSVLIPGLMKQVKLERGQFITGRRSLHSDLYPERDDAGNRIVRDSPAPHPTTVWRWLESLAEAGQLRIRNAQKFSVVTVCNYGAYQDDSQTDAPVTRQSCASDAPTTRQPRADDAPIVRTEEEGKKGRREERTKEAATPPARRKFTPPTVEEVAAYCAERASSIAPQEFVDYYMANGWVQGRGKPIRDWRACVRTWETNNFRGKPKRCRPLSTDEADHGDFDPETGTITANTRTCRKADCRRPECVAARKAGAP